MKTVAKYRLPAGGLLDRSQILGFTFAGRSLEGFVGDTVASALLAHGIHFVGRSFKYHRPRGIYAAGVEEPNALLRIGRGARATPNLRATEVPLHEGLRAAPQNAWPSLDVDLLSINNLLAPFMPAGFYYKTFKQPAKAWSKLYEPIIRRAAGLGVAPAAADPDVYEKRYDHAEVLVVGAGPAGLAAALAAAKGGKRVVLAEQDFVLGGSLHARLGETIDGKPARVWLAEAEAALRAAPHVRILPRTVCFGAYDHGLWGLLETLPADAAPQDHDPDAPRQRLCWLRAGQAVLATGSIERPLVFPGNDLPGVMLASAASAYVNRFAVKPGERIVVAANNDEGYLAALHMIEAGIEVVGIADARREPEGELPARLLRHGVAIFPAAGVARASGWHDLRHVELERVEADGSLSGRGRTRLRADTLLLAGGRSPSLHLASHLGARAVWSEEKSCLVMPEGAAGAVGEGRGENVRLAGAAAASFSLHEALEEGTAAGLAAADLPESAAAPPACDGFVWHPPSAPTPVHFKGARGKAFVDLQNDATAKDIALALREGYRSAEHLKRYTTIGMATDQGKLAGANAVQIAAAEAGTAPAAFGTTTFRPPYTPVTLAAFAGRELDAHLQPERLSPLHGWSAAQGAAWEPVGQWQRAWYYPRSGEGMGEAVQRESLAVRRGAGFMDASTLGKYEIRGPDAAEFLNRVYTGGFKKLAVGRCRYGLMLNEEGVLLDDGVVARLGEEHFYATTTTGGAARVMAWLELWHQTEWPELCLAMHSVSEQWAAIALNGPKARRILGSLTDLDLSDAALPYLHFCEGRILGAKARILRVSFTGELGYELHIPPSRAAAVAEALMEAGAEHGITPYGTETMHLLRAEKGYIIAGQDNEGTSTPDDLGLSGLCSTKKDYLGRRGAERAGFKGPGRKQLVGLLPEDPSVVVPEGAVLASPPASGARLAPPFAIEGHVTSSYRSPELERGFAMGLLRDGRARTGDIVLAAFEGRSWPCRIASPVFLDPEGARLSGEG